MDERWSRYYLHAHKKYERGSGYNADDIEDDFIREVFSKHITHIGEGMNFDYMSFSPRRCWDLIKALKKEEFEIGKIFGDVQYRGGHGIIKNVRIDLSKLEKLSELERPFEDLGVAA